MSLFVATSPIHGLGLYTSRIIETGQDIGYIFNKVNASGSFAADYRENLFGKYTNHSEEANAEPVIIPQGISLKAKRRINRDEEITADYKALIAMFDDDPSLIGLIKFW